MANPRDNQSLDPITTAVLAGGNNVNNPMINQLLQMQLARLQREEDERLAAIEQKRQVELAAANRRLQDAKMQEADRMAQEKTRDMCSHRMSNGTTLVAGQSLGGGKMKALCQFCLKSWNSWQDVPPGLHPPAQNFGGPKY